MTKSNETLTVGIEKLNIANSVSSTIFFKSTFLYLFPQIVKKVPSGCARTLQLFIL